MTPWPKPMQHWQWLSFTTGIGQVQGERAQELDPLSSNAFSELALLYWMTGQYDESIAQFQKALDLYPNTAVIRTGLAWAYAMKHMYPQALAEFGKIPDQDKAMAAENQFVASGLGWVYAISGRRADALKITQELKEL